MPTAEKKSVSTAPATRWFRQQRWTVFAFQRQTWQAMLRGRSGLVHASTGSGKTYAVWWGALMRARQRQPDQSKLRPPLSILWLTPMRALATDTVKSLAQPLSTFDPQWDVVLRTGDTSSAERARQNRRPPFAMVTTPESLTLMLSQADSAARLSGIHTVIVDEWHELLGNKRGTQVQLALARLQRLKTLQGLQGSSAQLSVWGLSATLGNLSEAIKVLCQPVCGPENLPVLIQGGRRKKIRVDTLLPKEAGRFPWGGHLGMAMRDPVIAEIERSSNTLVFCNTRSQAELWYQAIIEARPEWAGLIALHHGSLDRKVRNWVEDGLKDGSLKAVVCTASLDLGVDFSPVERVLQIGSAKGVARLLQRAGRAGHAPGGVSRVTLVPTNALELIESAAAQDAIAAEQIEARDIPVAPLDVLVQHLVTVALGTGFVAAELLAELKTCYAYQDLTEQQFQWAMDFVTRGGPSLYAYPEYSRLQIDSENVYRVPDKQIARRHRMSIGTIVSDSAMAVRYLSGGRIGTVEESFISRLNKGDCFLFNGKLLELIRTHEMTAYVRRAKGRRAAVPRWGGGSMPLSSELSAAVLQRVTEASRGVFGGPEMRLIRPLLRTQQQWSALPDPRHFLIEHYRSREGQHVFMYPFAGRHVHIGLASLIAWRLSKRNPATFSIAVNDYGIELLSHQTVDWTPLRDGRVLDADNLLSDVLSSLNSGELAQRRFREIARIAGLVFQGFPGAPRATRQLQASTQLFFEVFRAHDPDNMLLGQAEREVLERELEIRRLTETLTRLRQCKARWIDIERPTPLAFPLMVERLREKLSTEKLSDRIARIVADLERQADAG
ncbi:MAG: ligase-associated DNA damage response DEXH box helicase [Burkholderiaceae bacterium]